MTSSPHRITETILDVRDVGADTSSTTNRVTTYQGFKTVSATGTPEAISSTSIKVSSLLLQGYKAQGTLNTGNVNVGGTSVDAAATIAIVPGGSLTIDAPPGKYLDLSYIYLDVATAADGVGYFGVV